MRPTIAPASPGIFDYQHHVDRLAQRRTTLDRLKDMVDWEAFRPHLESALPSRGPGTGGRPAYDAVFLFRILVLQRLHDLSDEGVELAVQERLTWHRFLDIHVGSAFPDRNTIWRFRQALVNKGAFLACFDAFFEQIARHGVRLESGKIVDATIIEVPVQRNRRSEIEQIKRGEVPPAWSDHPAKRCQKDTDARWTRKEGQNFFGYKGHVKVDQRTKLIQRIVVTPANMHESRLVGDLVSPGDKRLYGDGAYRSAVIHDHLRHLRMQDWTNIPGRGRRPLGPDERMRNRRKSRIRARVEHVFAAMVTQIGGLYYRAIGLKRNAAAFEMQSLIYNMLRMTTLASA
jgi:IS5 family transposase